MNSTIIRCSPTLNNTERLRTLVNGLASDLAMSIVDSGHMYAMGLASSSLTPSARLGEILGGLNQVLYVTVSFAYDISILVLKSYAFV
jgi:Zn-dependent M16 (insulinase) family peptidase